MSIIDNRLELRPSEVAGVGMWRGLLTPKRARGRALLYCELQGTSVIRFRYHSLSERGSGKLGILGIVR